MFWTRFGSPTEKYGSGTEEEIEEMIASGKQVFLYFLDKPMPPSEMDSDEYKKVKAFKEKYSDTDSGCNIRVVGKNIDGACGLTGNYIKVWDVWPISYHYELSWSGSWVYSEIQLMTNPGRLVTRELNYQTKIYVHELGHSVALSHPESTATQAIMRGDIATDSVAIYTVQQNDKDNLMAKW